jgi:hypothetical protein
MDARRRRDRRVLADPAAFAWQVQVLLRCGWLQGVSGVLL